MRLNLAKGIILWFVFLVTILPAFCQPSGDPLEIEGPDSVDIGDHETYTAHGGNGSGSYVWSPDSDPQSESVGSLADPLAADEIEFRASSEGEYHLTLNDGGNGGTATGPVTKVVRVSDSQNEHFFSSADDSSGPKYRKIGLNGLPISDSKPQTEPETDQPPEETYIDALTLRLQHQTTDFYIPIVGDAVSLSIRRDIAPEVWDTAASHNPATTQIRPFGPCWSSNVCSYMEYVGASGETPASATAVDENGSQHRFVQVGLQFIPIPNSWSEQSESLNSLAVVWGGTPEAPVPESFMFQKKFGNTVEYAVSGVFVDQTLDESTTHHEFYRANKVTDRFGTEIIYRYNNGESPNLVSSLIPSSIECLGYRLNIILGTNKKISRITDNNGNYTEYFYNGILLSATKRLFANHSGPATPDDAFEATTSYGYSGIDEPDPKPPNPDNPNERPIIFAHLELGSITDPMGHTHSFSWNLDHSKEVWDSDLGSYRSGGNTRTIRQVNLPVGTSYFSNDSDIKIIYTGVGPNAIPHLVGPRANSVIDAENHRHEYVFTNPEIFKLSALSGESTAHHSGFMIFYNDLTIRQASMVESYHFDISAGGALASVTDASGNSTSYRYNDPISGSTPGFPIATFSDPNSQISAAGTKTFSYSPFFRIMSESIDEKGRKTATQVNPQTGNRESEIITDENSKIIQTTEFKYESVFTGFLTKKIVKRASSDPAWTRDLVTQYVPVSAGNGIGNVKQEIIDPDGLRLVTEYSYDANGNKLTVKNPRNFTTTFNYDGHNRLSKTIFPDFTTKSIRYNLLGQKKAEIDERGNSTLYSYDALNRLEFTARDMNGNGTIERATSVDSDLVTSFTYNGVNSKLTTIDPNGNTTTDNFDQFQRLETRISPDRGLTQYFYDGPNSGGSTFDISGFKPTRIVDSRGYTTLFHYNSSYRLTSKEQEFQLEADGGSRFVNTSTIYDAVGNPEHDSVEVDGEIHTTDTIFDGLNRPTQVTYPDTTSTSTKYTATGLAWKITNERNYQTTTEYDAAGRLTLVTQPAITLADGSTKFPKFYTHYDPSGNVDYTVDPRDGIANAPEAKRHSFSYDSRNRKLLETFPQAVDAISGQIKRGIIETRYDNAGNVRELVDAKGGITRTEYDKNNRPKDRFMPFVQRRGGDVLPDNSSHGWIANIHTEYDFNGNVTSLRDENGHTTFNTYQSLNLLYTSTDAEEQTVTYEYDHAGNKTSVTDGRLKATLFSYDGLNRNTSITDDAGKSTVFTYDELNKRSRIDSLEKETTYGYDRRNRLTTVTYPIPSAYDSDRSYSYDEAGNLRNVTESLNAEKSNVAYTYDALNHVASETSNQRTSQYKYDVAGNRTRCIYGGTNRQIDSAYDYLNRLVTLTDGTRNTIYGYDLNGNVQKKTLPSGEYVITKHDSLNRTTMIQPKGFQFDQYFDLHGNLRKINESYSSESTALNRTVINTYDNVDRLKKEEITGGGAAVTEYGYDASNNKTTKILNGLVTTYGFNNLNQLTSFSGPTSSGTYEYDFNGARTFGSVYKGAGNSRSRITDHFAYDRENRISSVNHGYVSYFNGLAHGVVRNYGYSYDYRTRRVSMRGSGDNVETVFSAGTSVQEYSVSGDTQTLTVENIRGSDWGGGVGGILYTLRSGQTSPSFTHYNGRGDVVAKTDDTKNTTYRATYEAFGTRTQETGTTLDRQKANTKDEDSWGGLNEGMRYRDLETGTFLTRDPAGFVDGPNLYAYVKQNPWTSFDPKGLQAMDAETAEFLSENGSEEFVRKQQKSQVEFKETVQNIKATTDAVASLNPVQNIITAVTGKSALGEQVSTVDQSLAVAGAVAGPLGMAVKEVKALAKATTLLENGKQGKLAEKLIGEQLVETGENLVGSQVGAQTSEGLRVIDHLTDTGTGLINNEVKSGNAVRTAKQIAKDNAMAEEGAKIVGKNAPPNLKNKVIKIETKVHQVPKPNSD